MTLDELKELIELVAEKSFAEFEVEREGFKLKIVANHPPTIVASDPHLMAAFAAPQALAQAPVRGLPHQHAAMTSPATSPADSAPVASAAPAPDESVQVVKSP